MKSFVSRSFVAFFCVVAAGCGGGGSTGSLPVASVDQSSRFGGPAPDVVQNGTVPINWTQFAGPTTGFGVSYAVAKGADNNMWFGNTQGGLMQVQMSGKETLVPLSYVYSGTSTRAFVPGYGIAVGKDKNFYMTGTNYNNNAAKYIVGIASTAGKLTFADIPSGDYGGSGSLGLGPDGNVWFTEQSHVAKVTPAGLVTEYAYPSGATSNSYGGVTSGPDGNVWFTEYNNGIVAKVVPATGKITEYTLSAQGLSCNPESIVTGPDGYLYFTCNGGARLGQISTAGVTKSFYDAYGITYVPEGLAIGPDGNPWFADSNGAYIGEFDPTNESFTNYVPPYAGGTVYNLALGPDGNFWSPENDNKINVYVIKTIALNPAALSFTAPKSKATVTISEPGTKAWTAKSVSSGVCAVTQGTSPDLFSVTAAGQGTTTITFKDAIGNSRAIKCSVK